MSHDFCDVGGASLDESTGALVAQCKGAPVADDGTAPDYGQAPFMCTLGIWAHPWPSDENGSAEAIVATDIPGMSGAIVGMRDVRTAKIAGNLEPGDTGVGSTGPNQAAVSLYKERKRQVLHRTKDSRGKDIVIVMDGSGDKITIAGFGLAVELSREQGIVLASGGTALQIKDGVGSLTGTWVLGGRTPLAPLLYSLTPVVGTSGTATPAPGVFLGV